MQVAGLASLENQKTNNKTPHKRDKKPPSHTQRHFTQVTLVHNATGATVYGNETSQWSPSRTNHEGVRSKAEQVGEG